MDLPEKRGVSRIHPNRSQCIGTDVGGEHRQTAKTEQRSEPFGVEDHSLEQPSSCCTLGNPDLVDGHFVIPEGEPELQDGSRLTISLQRQIDATTTVRVEGEVGLCST